MLYEVLKHIRNFFPVEDGTIDGTFTIEDGTIDLPLLENQYFLIEGSILNDGVHLYQSSVLSDESFTGSVTPLRIPSDFLSLVQEIEEWQEKFGKSEALSPYTAESFGGYSYQRSRTEKGGLATWKDIYRDRLNAWRKL